MCFIRDSSMLVLSAVCSQSFLIRMALAVPLPLGGTSFHALQSFCFATCCPFASQKKMPCQKQGKGVKAPP